MAKIEMSFWEKRGAVSLADYLFSPRLESKHLGLRFTAKWLAEMERRGLAQRKVRVLSLCKPPDSDDEEELRMFMDGEWPVFHIEMWGVGHQIPQEVVDEWADKETGELHILYELRGEKWRFRPLSKSLFSVFKKFHQGTISAADLERELKKRQSPDIPF